MKRTTLSTLVLSVLLVACLQQPQVSRAQAPPAPKAVTTPKEFFGFNIGDDYCLANYQQLKGYWEKLERESDRMKLVKIGDTEEGRPQLMAIVTSPANHRNLSRYQQIARRLALADGLSDAEARKLAAEGKAVVWIDAGIHASETLCPQMLIETVYQFLSATDEETLRILDNVIILFVNANPDGQDLVADWYMREKDPKRRSLGGVPRLYQKYIGHDDNRDFYANTQAESKNLNRILYREWFPQIMYNHHQTGPAGTVLFCPPFRDPFNYFCDPLVINGIDAVGAAMVQRFLSEDKPGATIRSGAPYSTWFNGGLRTTASFHNIIGLLTETIGSPTPTQIPLVSSKQLPKADYLAPIAPQEWHFRQSVDYSVTANRAVLDYASRHREQLLYNIWHMGHNAIERGNHDSWTITPKIVEAAQGARGGRGAGEAEFKRLFRDPAKRDPRGFILPANQPDFLTATKFINALLGCGVQVHQATADFEVAGKKYPKGSYVVKSAQAFRAHVLDMFEPQDHPNDFAYPGGPPVPPYDSAGYTLAFQMGVKFDRILEAFDGPFAEIKDLVIAPPAAQVLDTENAVGFFLSARQNDAFRAVNRLLKAGEEVRRLQEPFAVAGFTHPAGMFFIPRKPTTLPVLQKIAADIGTPFRGSPEAPGKQAVVVKPMRIGLWDRYGGSMPSGWTRWILEQFEFPFELVFAPELDRGKLREKFDVIILVDGAIAGRGLDAIRGDVIPDAPFEGAAGNEQNIPEEYRGRRGGITTAKTGPQLRQFLENGGTILTIGSSTGLGNQLSLPIANHLVEKDAEGKEKVLARDKFYVPSSVLRVKVDPAAPLAWGIGDEVDVLFSASPTFKMPEDAEKKGLRRIAWFDGKTPLRSGWAWGQEHLDGGTAIIDAKVGKGRLVLFGPQILFRGQPHGTFKFLFNGIVEAVGSESGSIQALVAPPSNEGIGGTLILSGRGPVSTAVIERFATEVTGKKGNVVLLASTKEDAATTKTQQDLTAHLTKKGIAFTVLPRSPGSRTDDALGKTLEEAVGVWLGVAPAGGDSPYVDPILGTALKRLLTRGGVVAGEGSLSAVDLFGLVPGTQVTALEVKNEGLDPLRQRLRYHPGSFGIGIESESTVVIKGRTIGTLGDGAVHLLQEQGTGRPASDKLLKGRDLADLVAQRRSAFARTQPPFPPEKLETPNVPKGALFIGGGGGLSDDLWKRFIDLAGGPDAPIVVIPTAMDDPVPAEPGEARALKLNGAKNVTILHTRKRAEANTEAFVKPLLQAKGVWFSGGRQWRFVDSYEGTATEKAIHEVLERGGVIGGSSAGASIQSEYMPRGDPLGNLNIIAEGYEHGFGFLKGVAVDQHFFARKRLADMTQLMKAYPQLLGIGIDEGTAIIVRGTKMEVVGKSKVAVYDRRKAVKADDGDCRGVKAGGVIRSGGTQTG